MDRRTLLFIAISSLTLIGVNTYFERQRLEEVKQWRETHPPEQEEVVKKEETPRPTLDEKVYVLSNPTMQIAFSTIGGAIKEINLPFKSDKHPESVVRPIAFDREMVEEDPQNANFPATPYYTAAEPPVFHEQGEKGGYYPLLRRSLITPKMTVPLDPKYYAFNFSSDFPELATIPFE
ncbi:MAG: hypothetical protein KDK65_07935, partial [Chlamydiia bacterium]|nr:hypothetical protein [Chlamydiia bacterium]